LLADEQPICIEALIANPHFTEVEALRLLHSNRNSKCALVLLRHPVWGRKPEVLRAAVRSEKVPLGVALGLLALLSNLDVETVAASPEVRGQLRAAASRLLRRRRAALAARQGAAPS
jgi:hypothetical protein